MQITVEVSQELGQQLQQFQDRLPEVVERGLLELLSEQSSNFVDEREIPSVVGESAHKTSKFWRFDPHQNSKLVLVIC